MIPRFGLLGLLLLVAACAQPARTSQMIHHPTEEQVAAVPESVRDGVEIGTIAGGEETDPMWMSEVGNREFGEALEVTLQSFRLYAFEADAPYRLDARLIDLDQPLIGFDIEVTCTAHYTVTRRSDGEVVYDEILVTPYTATIDDAFMGVERLRLANEGAVRTNIETFVNGFLAVADDL